MTSKVHFKSESLNVPIRSVLIFPLQLLNLKVWAQVSAPLGSLSWLRSAPRHNRTHYGGYYYHSPSYCSRIICLDLSIPLYQKLFEDGYRLTFIFPVPHRVPAYSMCSSNIWWINMVGLCVFLAPVVCTLQVKTQDQKRNLSDLWMLLRIYLESKVFFYTMCIPRICITYFSTCEQENDNKSETTVLVW